MTIYEEIIEGLKAASNGSNIIGLNEAISVVNKVKNVYVDDGKLSPIYEIVKKMNESDEIHEHATREVYNKILSMYSGCVKIHISYVSKYIIKYFNYKIVDKKINGRKYRLFIKI